MRLVSKPFSGPWRHLFYRVEGFINAKFWSKIRWTGISSKGRYISKEVMSKGFDIRGRIKTVYLFITDAFWRFEECSKWTKSKDFLYRALIWVRRFPDYWVRGIVLQGLSNKFLWDTPELQTLNFISQLKYYNLKISWILLLKNWKLIKKGLCPQGRFLHC